MAGIARLETGAKNGIGGKHGQIIDEKLLHKILIAYVKYSPNRDAAQDNADKLVDNLNAQTKAINGVIQALLVRIGQ